MNYIIREIKNEEYPVLEEFLYQGIFVPEGSDPPPRSILKDPNIDLYISKFGENKDDYGLVALADEKIVGAIWTRIMKDYGHVDNLTPSLSMSVLKEYRGFGIGTDLLKKMLISLKDKGYSQVSLSVQKSNYAFSMYQKAGFDIFKENEEDYIMICKL